MARWRVVEHRRGTETWWTAEYQRRGVWGMRWHPVWRLLGRDWHGYRFHAPWLAENVVRSHAARYRNAAPETTRVVREG